jgi:hypothetical protein
MTQQLKILESDTASELRDEIKKYLKDGEFHMVSLSVVKKLDKMEAWILVEDHAIAGFE